MKDGGYTQVGIVSRGTGCASYAGIYTDVAAYRDWIEGEAGPSCEDDEDWHKPDDPDKHCEWVGGMPVTRCAVKGPGWGQENLRASYACPSVCGGTCKDSRSWTKTGGEDWKGCAWVSIHPLARCKVWGEEPGEEGRVLAATACPDSCA